MNEVKKMEWELGRGGCAEPWVGSCAVCRTPYRTDVPGDVSCPLDLVCGRLGCDGAVRMEPLDGFPERTEGGAGYEVFGRLVWEMIEGLGNEFCGSEWSEEVLPLAAREGLCRRVVYDPRKHGDIESDTGEEIWFWGVEEGGE